MLSPLTCEWGATSAAGVKDESLILSGMTCSGSLATLGAVGIVVGLLLHVPLYLGIVLKECEIDPLTKVPFQAGSAPAAFRIEVLKISALVVIHLFAGLSQVGAGLLTTGLWLWIVYVTIVRLPYLGHAHSIVRATLAGGIMWMFGAATVQSTGGDVRVALAAGAVLVAALSGFLAKHRIKKAVGVVTMYYAVRAEVGPNSKRYHRFHDEEEPEVSNRGECWSTSWKSQR